MGLSRDAHAAIEGSKSHDQVRMKYARVERCGDLDPTDLLRWALQCRFDKLSGSVTGSARAGGEFELTCRLPACHSNAAGRFILPDLMACVSVALNDSGEG